MDTLSNLPSPVDRRGTHCVKWDRIADFYPRHDLLSFAVADMDFSCPAQVVTALQQRVAHPVYGYTGWSAEYTESLCNWYNRRHNFGLNPSQVEHLPGLVPVMAILLNCLTQEGDGVVVQPPVYFPFFQVVEHNHRQVYFNQLIEDNGRWSMDQEHLETCFAQGAKVMFLCNPHNPVGRVWTVAELQAVLELARRYNVLLVSDEIHCDFAYQPHIHTSLFALSLPQDRVITLVSPGKSFNLTGMHIAAALVKNVELKNALNACIARFDLCNPNPLSQIAAEAAFNNGELWLRNLKAIMVQNAKTLQSRLLGTPINMHPLEGTFLAWLDCRSLKLDDAGLDNLFCNKAGLGLFPGYLFGPGGYGFMRWNIACSTKLLHQGIDKLLTALKEL